MRSMDMIKYRPYMVAGLIVFFSLFALWLRLLPLLTHGDTDKINMVAMDDPLYNLRQVELMLAHFPQYSWFDPMTNYPLGTIIYWGPIFPSIIAVCCLITGAISRPEIISTALWMAPLMAAVIVALMYFVGRVFGDWKTGVLASGFTAIVSGQFFTISWYGYIDHHIAEVLFSTLFCLLYSYAILSAKDAPIDPTRFASYKKTLLLSLIAGGGYLLGLFVMPTMILFAMIAGIFTLVQFIIDVYRNRATEYLLIINGTVFLTAIVGLLLFGLKDTGIGLSTYSIGHIYAYVGLIGGTAVLYALAFILKGRERWYYPAALLGSASLVVVILAAASPQIYSLFISSLVAFFGQQAITDTVLEAQGWSLDRAWQSLNYGLILFAGGALVLLYNNLKDEHPHQVFALVWSLVMFLSTWQHIRYEYYLAINIALLSAVCASFVLGKGWTELSPLVGRHFGGPTSSESAERTQDRPARGKPQKMSHKKSVPSRTPVVLIVILVTLVAVLGVLFTWTSATQSYTRATEGSMSLNPDWRESLEWLGNNSPETGVDYLAMYDPKTFAYPKESYGVMSWWDYGHIITYLAKRIPNANPFQQGVVGANGAAAYFITSSEEKANGILDHDGTRYVVTDIEMDTGKFPAMATWDNSSLAADPYMKFMFIPGSDNPKNLESRLLFTEQYYLTMVSRLHTFDGSMTPATLVYYIEYSDPYVTGVTLPVVTSAKTMNATDAVRNAGQFNQKAPAGYHAQAFGISLVNPVRDIPALRHYRLIHESPTNVFGTGTPDVKYVKVFEYVKGAHIRGNGIIELPLVSNTGRNFTYRQESTDGEFVVPYSTTGNPYGVKATGNYRITGSGQEFAVPETAVMQGTVIT